MLFLRETLEYYFEEFDDEKSVKTERSRLRVERQESVYGKYHRLNHMASLPANSRAKEQEIRAYAEEEQLARDLFKFYE